MRLLGTRGLLADVGRFDVALALGLACFAQLEIWIGAGAGDPLRISVPAALAMTLPLIWRRRAAFGVCSIVLGTLAAAGLAGLAIDSLTMPALAVVVAVYSAGAYAERSHALGALAVSLAGAWISVLATADSAVVEDLVFASAVVSAPWAAGRVVRERVQHAGAAQRRAEELEATHAAQAAAAVADERARIARELHDVIAHSVSVMVVQAGAAEEVFEDDPEQARQAMGSIRKTGRDALGELRRLLGLLREAPEEGQLVPQPKLDDLGDLTARMREAGLSVGLAVEGDPPAISPGVQLSAYRIVQEALTNTLRHAPDAETNISIRYRKSEIDVEIVDTGSDAIQNANGTGHGLIGMSERVNLYGGTLEVGPTGSGGFRVHATFPIAEQP